MTFVLLGFGVLLALGLLVLAVVSRREGESLACRRSLIMAAIAPLPYLATALWTGPAILGWILVTASCLLVVLLLIPTGFPQVPRARHDARVDERTIMFSRAALVPGSERFESYYDAHPEHRDNDDRFRARPGLLSPDATLAEPLSFAAAAASFRAVEQLASLVSGEPAGCQLDLPPQRAARFVKGWARQLGAVSCGITALAEHHLYTVKGRGSDWGHEIVREHAWAVALTVEMDHGQLASAPLGPTIMESAQQYLESGRIAVQIAEAIRGLGWNAEAHIDANYKVICPPLARDAGLGELGRMGLLMTPTLGPRVRLAVVTTDLPMIPDPQASEPTTLDFCERCEKCADICPAAAIPRGPRADQGGRLRWTIDQEACFDYWCRTGTDCGQCMSVCPYSHPDGFVHALVRRGLRHSSLFRQLALRADDLLYGRRPRPRSPADWLR